jgi:hypothetical protein
MFAALSPSATAQIINGLWGKRTIVYCLSVGTYRNVHGNGVDDL